MMESKSMFARRIGRPLNYVIQMCKRGVFPTDDNGRVMVESAMRWYNAHKRGRPQKWGALVPVVVHVRPGQIREIKQIAKIMIKKD